jgi:hypothetical protein
LILIQTHLLLMQEESGMSGICFQTKGCSLLMTSQIVQGGFCTIW